jgi:hypothetical protein
MYLVYNYVFDFVFVLIGARHKKPGVNVIKSIGIQNAVTVGGPKM